MDDHIKAEDTEFELVVHPAFASRCTVKRNGGAEREIYKQKDVYHLNGRKRPTKHQIRLKGKGNQRDISFQVDDPNHSIARITVELYAEGHAVNSEDNDTDTVFTIENDASICPPRCPT